MPIIHDSTLFLSETRLDVAYGLSAAWVLGLTAPFRVVGEGIRYLDGSTGAPVQLVTPNIHHRNETLVGLADPTLFARASHAFGAFGLEARFGATLPLGKTEEDPFRLGAMGLPHEHVQLGTGTVNPIAGLSASRALWGGAVGAWASAFLPLYANDKAYQAGDRFALGAQLAHPFGRRVEVRGGAEVLVERPDRWHGAVPGDEGNRGRVDLLAEAGVSVRLSASLALDAQLSVPLATYVVGGQLSYPLIGTIGLVATFGGPARHAHTEEPGPPAAPPATTLADVDDLVTDGRDAALTPIAGEVTVFDFWAPWCAPCRDLDARLRAIPGIAIRKLNVVDWDSPLAKRHLVAGGFDLPHVIVHDAAGARVLERSGAPADLAAAIAALAPRRIDVAVTADGFTPAHIVARAGEPIVLVFTRTTDATCATDVVIGAVHRDLPRDVPVAIALVPRATTPFACSMNMVRGSIDITP